jgi:hypothetical protein
MVAQARKAKNIKSVLKDAAAHTRPDASQETWLRRLEYTVIVKTAGECTGRQLIGCSLLANYDHLSVADPVL